MKNAVAQASFLTEIFPNLFVGGIQAAANKEYLQESEIKVIINIGNDAPNSFPDLFEYHRLSIRDNPHTDLVFHFPEVFKIIDDNIMASKPVLIHDSFGVSMAPAFCAAYLVSRIPISLKESLEHLKENRPVVNICLGYLTQLMTFEKDTHGGNSIMIIGGDDEVRPDLFEIQATADNLEELKKNALKASGVKLTKSGKKKKEKKKGSLTFKKVEKRDEEVAVEKKKMTRTPWKQRDRKSSCRERV
eukprot:TRINITY_DN3181_c0_g1_i1.p1 TRINITY_DN3181_c0_g1~~TRINITY_DN3181_c0_g1_i1.p1  ORF type:complete len:246 (+),score=63.61 TRINITY_DN3181_c0_g1_i1:85-822(+)